MVDEKKCKPGCRCGRHKSSKCQPGCTCKRHKPNTGSLGRSCPEGCACGKHRRARRIDWDSPDAKRQYDREYARTWRAANPEKVRAAVQRWQSANSHYVRHRLTTSQWKALLEEQKGLCYLCGDPLNTERRRGIHVDHDHGCCTTERTCGYCIRGLACSNCNQGIGSFRDDPERMRRAADALELAQARLTARQAARKKIVD